MNSRIAIDGTSALSQRGGIGRFTRGLIFALASYDGNHSYEIGYTKEWAQATRPALPTNFCWKRIGLTEKQAAWIWHRLRLPLHAERWFDRPALFHSPDFTLPPLRRARGVMTVHDLSFEVLDHVHVPRLRDYLKRTVPHSIERADHIFADSASTREEIIKFYGTNPAKISVVYPGIEARFHPFDRDDPQESAHLVSVRQRYQLEDPFILSIGTLEPRKNLSTLIRAYATYRKEGDGVARLVIAGGGGWLGQRETLESLVQELGLKTEVRFTGYVEDEDLPALINLAEVLVYPSLYEGFGLPVLEALACGVPAITCKHTSLPEVGGEAAYYLEDPYDVKALAQAIGFVLNDIEARRRMITAGLRHAARFDWRQTAEQVVGLYEQVLQS